MKLKNNEIFLTEEELKYIAEHEESKDENIEVIEEFVGHTYRGLTQMKVIIEYKESEGNYRYFSIDYLRDETGDIEDNSSIYEGGWFKEMEKREIITHEWVVMKAGGN